MTFGEVSEKLLNTVLTSNTSSQRIDVVFDVYRDQSIKDAERANHGISFSKIIPSHIR